MVLKVTSPSSNNPGSSPSTAEEVPEFSFQRGRERPVPARLSGSRCLSALRTGLPMKVGRGGGRGRLPSKSGSARSAPNLSELSDSRAGAGHATTITRKAAQTSELVEHKRHSQAAAKQVSRARNSGSTACQWRRREENRGRRGCGSLLGGLRPGSNPSFHCPGCVWGYTAVRKRRSLAGFVLTVCFCRLRDF